jgi:hypothetical protein
MIPYQIALIAFIPLAALIMYDRNRARGFSIVILLGMMFLPAREAVDMPGVPDLDKYNVPLLGALLGTILFHPRSFDQLRIHPSDLLIIGIIQSTIATSIVEHYGMRDGVVRSLEYLMTSGIAITLGRMHLGTPSALRTFLLCFIVAACVYTPLTLWEFRMSPQIHIMVYGYFQHDFIQFYRNGFFRPIGFFPHALKLGQFFAFAAFLALFPMRRDLTELFGWVGRYLFVLPGMALLSSMSYGPYMLFFFLSGLYFVLKKQLWVAFVLPVIMFIWLIALFAGSDFGLSIVSDVENVNPARAESLEYRLTTMTLYRDQINEKMWVGWGGHGRGRIDDVATDSQALIILLAAGWIGSGFFYAWWVAGMYMALKISSLTPNTALDKRTRAVAALASMSIAISIIDNALDQYCVIMLAGCIGIRSWLETRQAPEEASASSALIRELSTSVQRTATRSS